MFFANKSIVIKPYRTIETLPIWHYKKVPSTGDLRYLLKLEDYDELPKKCKIGLQKIWQDIQTEFFEKVDFNDTQDYYFEKSQKLLMLKLDEAIAEAGETHNPKLSRMKVDIKLLENELKDDLLDNKQQTFEDQIVMLESHYKIEINPQRTSTLKFYKYLQLYERQQQQSEEIIERAKNKTRKTN